MRVLAKIICSQADLLAYLWDDLYTFGKSQSSFLARCVL